MMLDLLNFLEEEVDTLISTFELVIILVTSIFWGLLVLFWQSLWKLQINELNRKIWRTKGMLNIIPMAIIQSNEALKK